MLKSFLSTIKGEMMSTEYWLERMSGEDQIIMQPEEVEDFNRGTREKMTVRGLTREYSNIQSFPATISRVELISLIKKYSASGQFPEDMVDSGGNPLTGKLKREIIENTDYKNIKKKIEVKFGMVIRRSNLRAYPTEKVCAENEKMIDHDHFQLTALTTGTPVAILHRSRDSKWVYVQSDIYPGWIKKENIAPARVRDELSVFLDNKKFLVVTGSRVKTEPNPFLENISSILFQMGDRIPLLDEEEIPETLPEANLQGQSAEGCYAVKVPIKNSKGYLDYAPALLAGNNDVSTGYLEYRRNILIRQAFKMLGERYGWGGMFNRRDCSRFIMDIYRTTGIMLPRDASAQLDGAAGEVLEFSGDRNKRLKVMNELQPGDPVYLPGHVVMYLGTVKNRHFVIHAGAGYGEVTGKGEFKPISVHGVFVMDIERKLMSGKRSYLEAFTAARKFR